MPNEEPTNTPKRSPQIPIRFIRDESCRTLRVDSFMHSGTLLSNDLFITFCSERFSNDIPHSAVFNEDGSFQYLFDAADRQAPQILIRRAEAEVAIPREVARVLHAFLSEYLEHTEPQARQE